MAEWRRDVLVRKGWFFWQAVNPREAIGLLDTQTVYRSWTREGAIRKARRRRESRWEDAD